MVGGWLFVYVDWQAIFWFLALIGAGIWVSSWRFLPETLERAQFQRFNARNLMAGYRQMATSARFMALVLASGIPFNGMFLYVLAAPVFLGEHLQLGPTQFWWFLVFTIGGIMGGAFVSGRLAGRIKPRHQVRHGLLIMLVVSLLNVALNALLDPHPAWAMLPIAVFSFGWALMVPVVTLLVLDQVPQRRGMASSMQACISAVANGIVAGVIVPLVMHSTLALALASLAMLLVGIVAWVWVKPRLA
jgi:DHA1 family bicyclomycin/chloramphenicol resistance-like MFS transporter